MLSFWEQQSLLNYDVVIVGAGITGLSTAASIKERAPGLSVLVLERGTLPTGASTRNAGFACFGSVSELVQDQKTLGDEGMTQLVKRRWDGLQKTIARLGAARIGFEPKGGYELLNTHNAHYLDHISSLNETLKPLFPGEVFRQADDQITTFGFGQTQHMIFNPYEGQLNTGLLMRTLWQYCNQLGVQVITGTSVKSIEAPGHIITDNYRFQGKAVALCTNAFTSELVDQPLDLKPGRGMVMVVTPQNPHAISGIFHYEEGYYYFRDFEQKIIFGGGRNLDMAGESTAEFGINQKIAQQLLADLKTIILPGMDFRVDMKWSGIMAFGPDKSPILQETAEGLFIGARLGGMGVALGSMLGDELAQTILTARF